MRTPVAEMLQGVLLFVVSQNCCCQRRSPSRTRHRFPRGNPAPARDVWKEESSRPISSLKKIGEPMDATVGKRHSFLTEKSRRGSFCSLKAVARAGSVSKPMRVRETCQKGKPLPPKQQGLFCRIQRSHLPMILANSWKLVHQIPEWSSGKWLNKISSLAAYSGMSTVSASWKQ